MPIDVDAVGRIIREVAEQEILPRFRLLDRSEVSAKKGGEVVTVADVAAERALTARLESLAPGSVTLGEEAFAADPAVMDRLGGDAPVWVIDPIDGTANYTRGHPVFAVMVALVVGGETRMAWIHDPVFDRTAVAERGSGATYAGRPMRVSNGDLPLGELTGAVYAGGFSTPEFARMVHANKAAVRSVPTLACAGWEYLRLAGGGSDFALFTRSMPWDHLAGMLIHEEAGGYARTIDEERWHSHDGPPILIAPDQGSWRRLRQVLVTN